MRTSTVVHRDDSMLVLDVRCQCGVGRTDEEEVTSFEFVLPLAGAYRRRTRVGDQIVDAASGYVAVPGNPQSISHISSGDRCIAVLPSPQLADEVGLDVPRHGGAVAISKRRLRAVVNALAVSSAGDDLAASEAWVALLDPGADSPLPPLRPQHRAAAARAREAIASAPGERWTMRSVAEVAGYAPHHLSRVFRACTGRSLADYRDTVRLTAAIALIRDGLPLADVAARVGYADHAHLCRRMSQVLGTSPSTLRARLSKP